MKPIALSGLFVALLAGCASPPQAPPPAPPATPPEAPAEEIATPEPDTPAPPAPGEAPADWHLLDATTDGVPGISAFRAHELLAGRAPGRTIVVAVLDSGVDTAHAALRPALWQNPRERPGTGRDDDGNGYADDTRGWNFIGGADGSNVRYDTWEVARLQRACEGRPSETRMAAGADSVSCARVAEALEESRVEAEQTLMQIDAIEQMLSRVTPVLQRALGSDSLTTARVTALRPTRPDVRDAREIYLEMARLGITQSLVDEARDEFRSQLEFKLNPSFDPRPLVGDDASDPTERHYGNPDVTGPDARHGTHVAGIIAAVREGEGAVAGIAPGVRIMSVRTVPDGDERDKDVANAIRYAVDNGAHIINMSFGKAYSPEKRVVDEAVRYADERGVLLVHAAGNDGADLAVEKAYPSPEYLGGGRAAHWIGVGASTWKGADSLAAPFSNYGPGRVDVFAPGMDVRSTIPDGGYEANSGTSMAAPVVSGLAALLMTYFPELGAAEVRCLILESVTRTPELMVVRPGGEDRVRFDALSATAGVVNAYEAVRLAQEGARCRAA